MGELIGNKSKINIFYDKHKRDYLTNHKKEVIKPEEKTMLYNIVLLKLHIVLSLVQRVLLGLKLSNYY
ncbi:MAG TPA: hypothetical protein DEG09_03645 [Marinilabiliaceae bacterium]|nr:hypothetical protein [Marinilabiliaceae bacterium]